MDEPKRSRRRRATRRVALRRRSDHLTLIHGDPTGANVDCVCELAATYFAKIKGRGCNRCRSHRPGRPRVSGGMCKIGIRDRIYRWRRQDRELGHLLQRQGVDLEGDEVACLSSPKEC
jgi:hypothetical protein